MQRSVAETIQEVIELTGFLCFLFRSTPIMKEGVLKEETRRRIWNEKENSEEEY